MKFKVDQSKTPYIEVALPYLTDDDDEVDPKDVNKAVGFFIMVMKMQQNDVEVFDGIGDMVIEELNMRKQKKEEPLVEVEKPKEVEPAIILAPIKKKMGRPSKNKPPKPPKQQNPIYYENGVFSPNKYYQVHKDQIKAKTRKVTCECGGIYYSSGLKKHLASSKHSHIIKQMEEAKNN